LIDTAAARGKQTGWPSKLNADQARQLRRLHVPVSRWRICAGQGVEGDGIPGARRLPIAGACHSDHRAETGTMARASGAELMLARPVTELPMVDGRA